MDYLLGDAVVLVALCYFLMMVFNNIIVNFVMFRLIITLLRVDSCTWWFLEFVFACLLLQLFSSCLCVLLVNLDYFWDGCWCGGGGFVLCCLMNCFVLAWFVCIALVCLTLVCCGLCELFDLLSGLGLVGLCLIVAAVYFAAWWL